MADLALRQEPVRRRLGDGGKAAVPRGCETLCNCG